MIRIIISIDEKEVLDGLEKSETNLKEVSLALYRLKQIERKLLDIEFEETVVEEETNE